MNASPADQRRLLEVAGLDARLRQEFAQQLTVLLGERDDLRTELKRVEADVAVVDARRTRDNDRLQTVSNPKDAVGLESELASLARRKSGLEDIELEVMERLEQTEAAVAEQERLIAETNNEGGRLSAEAKAVVAEADAELEAATRDRAAVVATIAQDLVALYDRLAARNPGAALLRARTCEGCRMMLSGTDIAAARQAAEDVVLTCPECGCILVRTEESGL